MAEGGVELTSQAPYVLAEYQSLDGILAPIRNLTRVKYACFDASKRYLAFGATTGDVFMFHRDTTAYITTITNKEGAVSQVALAPDDFVLGIATSRGHVVVLEHNARRPTVQAQRLQLSFEHKGSVVTCLEWNGVGTRLFVADNTGKVSVLNVSTSKAKSLFQSPPSTLMRLDSKVVQLNFVQDRLLASTLTRCYLGDTIREKFTQVGKKLRDGEFGGCFYPGSKPQDSMCIYAARPGSRIWQADLKGSVLKTHQFKEALAINPVKLVTYRSDTDALGSTASSASTTAFTKLLPIWASNHNSPFLISWSSNGLYVINPQEGEIVLWNDELKDVKDLRCVRNNIYIQLHSGEFCTCSLLTPVQAVLCFLQHSHATLCGQFLCQNQLFIPKPAFEKTVPSELCFELHDKLQEAGQISLAASVAKVLLDNYDIDVTKKPAKPKADPTKEDSLDSSLSNRAHVSVERAPTKRRSREAQKSRDEWGVASPRHVRCHSSEPVKTHVVYSPRPARKSVRRGSDPPPPSTIDKTLLAESSSKAKPTKACSPTLARRTIGPSSAQRERSLSLDAPRQGAHESQPPRTPSERPRQLPTAAKSSTLVGLSVGSRDQNKGATKVSSGSGRETPEDTEGSPTPGCSVVERGNNKKAYGSALRILPAIPASPLDSPMSPLDRVDPEVLASMYAEQDVGYESVYQYLSLGVYGSSLVPAAFTMRGADLAQLANVADLAKLRDTLSSRISNGKDTILKNLRGLESKFKYFSVDQAADVGLTSPLSVVPECTPAEPNSKPGENFSKHLTPKDEFWSFLPGVSSSFIEATLRASANANDPSIFYHGPSLVMVLEEWLEALHSTQISIVNQIVSTESAKLPPVISHCDSVQKSPDETFSSPSSQGDTKISAQLNLIKSIFTSDPFRLPSEVAEKARELAMLCFQTRTLGTVERVAAKVSEVEGREKLASSMYNGSSAATDVKLSKHSSTNSLGSEDTSTHCDLSLSMRSSASEKYGFHLSDMPTVDSCSESAMFQSMSSSCGGLSINLDFRPEESAQQPDAPSVRKSSLSQLRRETNGDGAESANQERGCEELAAVSNASPSQSPLRENESIGVREDVAVPTEGSSVLRDERSGAVGMNGFASYEAANSCQSVAGEGFTGQRNLSVYSDLSPSQGSQSEATSVSWMPMIPQSQEKTELFKNHVNDAKTALFIRYYFHLLDLEAVWDVVQLTENPCFETWSAVVLGVLQELKARHRNESGPEHLVIIAQQMQNMATQPWLLLAYLMLLHEAAQDKAADTFTKKASSLSARDILYFTQLCKMESHFLGAMQGALSCFTLPQMLSSFRKYLENEEVRWEWVTQCLQSVNNECLKCSCGAPSYNSHKTNWPMYEHLKGVLCNKDWISQKSLELCRTYAFWPGYLCALKHLGHRTEHLVNVIQLGDAELLMSDNFLGFVPESPQEWKLAMELVGRHRTERVVVVTCLSCGKPHKSTESQTPLTLQSVAQRMLASLGFEQAAVVLHELNLPRNSLGQGFYLASVLLTLIEQQQAALSHRMLSRLESYVWSRRPVTLPPQVADVLDREKQGLAGHDDLTDVQLQGSFVEEPESHWGGNIPLLSNCLLCGLPLGTTVGAHAVVMCHCGHCFHESCLPSPGDFCVICSEEDIWKR
ncbi:Hermansky-Pudlak syndrome 5 protein homolog [Rhipicephalus sanguineus]|uniref:Hermansky-Pudlak syndrome 5 protein homolog n=1 Tax=Rhipicephalus sanguineus TaxID=34632 RepID=UPI001895D12E|nr:Hermansky-Pudlak syndrome 5 protein homolog [Rhipicephalus sanguineus]